MTVRDLFKTVDRKAMLDFYNKFFDEITRSMLDNQIALFNKQLRIESDWTIYIREEEDDIIAKGIATEDDVYDPSNIGSLMDFALDFAPWGQVMSMEVSQSSLDDFEDHAVAALIFEEMVWHGWDQESQINRRDTVDDAIERSILDTETVKRLAENAREAEAAIKDGRMIDVSHLHEDDLRTFLRTREANVGLTNIGNLTEDQLRIVLGTPRDRKD